MTDRFYLSHRWQALRKSILRRDGYIDQVEKRYGKIKEGNLVHHIFPREDFPQYQYEPWNLITVSQATHNTLHDRNTNKLTQEGLNLLVRTARKQGISYRLSE